MRKKGKSDAGHRPKSKTHQRASKGVSTLARIDARIEQAKARLSALHARRKAIIAASKPPSPKERRKQIVAMAQAGASIEAIATKVQLSGSTIRHHLWRAIWDAAHEELLREGKATVVRPNEHGGATWDVPNWDDLEAKELELKQRLYPGVKWGTGGNSGGRSSYALLWPERTHPPDWRTMRIVLNDGTVDPPDA